MSEASYTRTLTTKILIWSGRVAGLASVIYLTYYIVTEPLPLIRPEKPLEQVLVLLFPLGIMFGLATMWLWEGFGSSFALACLGLFYVVTRAGTGDWPQGWNLVLFTWPAGLCFIGWLIQNRGAYRCPH